MQPTRPLGCTWGLPTGRCGEPGRLYPCGVRCDPHSPWAQRGWPEPLTPNDIARRKEQQ